MGLYLSKTPEEWVYRAGATDLVEAVLVSLDRHWYIEKIKKGMALFFWACSNESFHWSVSGLRRASRSHDCNYGCRKSGNPFLNIERECKILKMVNHPNVVKLFEIMDDPANDLIYFVFEFMGRGSILSLPTSKW